MSRHSIRVELPDLPGALARVATVVSEMNGDVISVDVHEVDGNNAVDELVVEFLTGLAPGELGDALERTGAGRLISCSPADARADPVVEALHWARDLVAAPESAGTTTLERVLAEACPAAGVWVAPIDAARDVAVGRLALVRSSPVVQRAEAVPPGFGFDTAGPVWLLAVADGARPVGTIAFLVRPVALRFTASEVARVDALVSIWRSLGARAGGAADRSVPRVRTSAPGS